MLRITNLKKYYGQTRGAEDVSFSVKKGEIFGFIGPNGAGKSTTIRCIMNLINKDGGSIEFDGKELIKNDVKAYEKIGYLPSEPALYKELKVIDMLKYNDSFYGKDTLPKGLAYAQKLQLDTSKKIGELSLGNIKKVGIVLSFMQDPKLVIMDEATSGLDPLMQEEVYKIILDEKNQGTTFLFSSHNLMEVKKLCDTVGIIKDGRIIKIASTNSLTTTEAYKVKYIENGEEKSLIYKDDINTLIKELSTKKLDKLLIEEPNLEEIFMHYYE
ncbi:MAG: ABC transporter ATP-binding protein [Lachnospiraceae bacterium]|nr:ABC transporter ATP-binding protein [Lachnospiraceae bacterium]